MIKLRIDVDYAYPSRAKSFLCTVLKKKPVKDYLYNSKIIARMINESNKEIKAYWFFTPSTIPDKEMLEILNPEKHEIALHVVNKPYAEMDQLRKSTGRKINYYSIHGTARFLAQIMWRRRIGQTKVQITKEFPLKSFHEFPTLCMDTVCYENPVQVRKIVEDHLEKGEVLEIHPEWLFQRGTLNHRGPYYNELKRLLGVDNELESLAVQKRIFAAIATDTQEYQKSIIPKSDFLKKLSDRKIDIFSFVERSWCCRINDPSAIWVETKDNAAILSVASYEEWWEKIGKKTRNMVRKAQKAGLRTEVIEPDEKFVEGIWKIYNETPIRQGRLFPHYGMPIHVVRNIVFSAKNTTFIGALFEEETVGFIQLIHGDEIAIISQILSLQKLWDKALNNALIAKAVEVCSNKHIKWVIYGRIGNHPSLDKFKHSNCFEKYELKRYYIPLTKKGRILTKLGLHIPLKDALPEWLKAPLLLVFNYSSRLKWKIKRKK